MIYHNLTEFIKIIDKDKCLLAIDLGQKKTGIAISDVNKKLSFPLKVITAKNLTSLMTQINQIIIENEIGGLVVGHTFDSDIDLEETRIFKICKKLIITLKQPIFLTQEHYSTKDANELMKNFQINRKKRHQKDDMIAASFILQETLDLIKKFEDKAL